MDDKELESAVIGDFIPVEAIQVRSITCNIDSMNQHPS